ncbi:hypothetical protein TNCV_529381 [Trichonephila clavipes]|nr:hypothetical protein TNCV_529381 [Trichonephila clavipes]
MACECVLFGTPCLIDWNIVWLLPQQITEGQSLISALNLKCFCVRFRSGRLCNHRRTVVCFIVACESLSYQHLQWTEKVEINRVGIRTVWWMVENLGEMTGAYQWL